MAAESAAELHARALAENERGRHGVARRLLRAALRQERHEPDPARRAHLLVSLAYHEAEQHSLVAGIALLDEADAVLALPDRVRGLIASQRGLLYMRAGDAPLALAAFDAAMKLFDDSAAPQPAAEDLCRVLLNRGLIHLQQRAVALARSDFTRCVAVASENGLEVLAAKTSHNLGYLSLLSGDLPRALREMDAVAPALSGLSPAMAAVYYVDRAQVLLAAGLLRDADDDLRQAVDLFRAAQVRQDQAVAELTRAQVALLEGRWHDARQLARTARRRFAARGASSWVLLADQVAITATVDSGQSQSDTAEAAATLAVKLATAGLDDESRRARLTAAEAARSTDGVTTARSIAGQALVLRLDDPIATRLQARALRARLADGEGRPDRADAQLRAALRDLHRYQSSFGSLDLQTAVSGHGRLLAEQGLARALAGGSPAAVFGWAERGRALSARLAPVVPPGDPEAAGLLEELRHARAELREQTLAGSADPALRAHCAGLERQVRQRSWYRPGPGQATEPAPLSRLREPLANDDATFVAHLLGGTGLSALVVTARRSAVTDLGPAAPVIEYHHRLRADLDVLAAANLPAGVRASVRTASRTSARTLDELLFGPLRSLLAGGPLLLAPSAALVPVPWTLLPTVAGRPSTVVGSATAWLGSRDRVRLPEHPDVVLAAGPGVPRGAEELGLVAQEWPTAARVSTLAGSQASAAAVRQAAGSADIVHIAAHGVHEPDNPLFSHLQLADGPLFGHELDQLPRPPAHVVLSACELGLAGTRPTDETLGMTAALLHAGTLSVVAGVARIADTVACRVGAAHHAGLRRGLPPAAALAAAVAEAAGTDHDDGPAPLVCFGVGW